jgi:hypothetical protein
MKIIDTDNFARDYPDEKVIADNITYDVFAKIMCDALNKNAGVYSIRYYKVVEDDYVLQQGFELDC